MAPTNVTPMKLSETLKHVVDSRAKKEQITKLQEQYAAGKLTKDKLQDELSVTAGFDAMLQALRILVPGYDEMLSLIHI